jgi:hypothetical protein
MPDEPPNDLLQLPGGPGPDDGPDGDEDLLYKPTDAPVLFAGLLAARSTGDELLHDVCERELTKLGIAVIFLSNFTREQRAKEGEGRRD